VRELFIYYRVQVAQEAHARRVVRTFQSQLCARFPQLVARLLCRPEESEGQQTWMEIYSTNPMLSPSGVTVELQAAIEAQALALAPCIVGSRHTEVFVPCAW
jgi:Domain of unknown function (DUF4936)